MSKPSTGDKAACLSCGGAMTRAVGSYGARYWSHDSSSDNRDYHEGRAKPGSLVPKGLFNDRRHLSDPPTGAPGLTSL